LFLSSFASIYGVAETSLPGEPNYSGAPEGETTLAPIKLLTEPDEGCRLLEVMV
jgi:hypothetical protein